MNVNQKGKKCKRNKDKNVHRYTKTWGVKWGRGIESLGYRDTLYLNKDSVKKQSSMTLKLNL